MWSIARLLQTRDDREPFAPADNTTNATEPGVHFVGEDRPHCDRCRPVPVSFTLPGNAQISIGAVYTA
jgi:hypothetical protein